MSAISPSEQSKYFEIFASLGPVNGFITGRCTGFPKLSANDSGLQAKDVLQNSGLDNIQLEKIW